MGYLSSDDPLAKIAEISQECLIQMTRGYKSPEALLYGAMKSISEIDPSQSAYLDLFGISFEETFVDTITK